MGGLNCREARHPMQPSAWSAGIAAQAHIPPGLSLPGTALMAGGRGGQMLTEISFTQLPIVLSTDACAR